MYADGRLHWELKTHSTVRQITAVRRAFVKLEERHFRFRRKRFFNFPLRFTISLSPKDVEGWGKSTFLLLFCSTVLITSWGVAFPEVSYRELFKIGFTSVTSCKYFSVTWCLNQARQGVKGGRALHDCRWQEKLYTSLFYKEFVTSYSVCVCKIK